MASPTFNIGRDTSVVYMGPLGQVNFAQVTMFDAKPITKTVKVNPLNGQPIARDIPDGWDFELTIERANVNADALQSATEAAFWAGVSLPVGTLYQYITETNGATSTFQFINCVAHLEDAGSWSQEKAVTMKLKGFSSQRLQVS